MATIFHLALASDWAEAQATGSYTVSTRGRSLAEEGFIHASRGDQWQGVRERFYADVTEPLVLLRIDTDLLDVPVVEEAAAPGGEETFPHIYGPLPVAAVVKVIPLDAQPTAADAPAAAAGATPTRTAPSAGDFSRTYFREMFFNAGLILLVVALGFVGLLVGVAIDHGRSGQDGVVASLLGLVGVVIGVVIAVALYRRHNAAARAR